VVLSVGRLGTWRRAKEGSSECGVERRRRGPFYRAGEAVGSRGGGRRWWSFTLVCFEGVKGGRGDGTAPI
jgi:hypothetical protein